MNQTDSSEVDRLRREVDSYQAITKRLGRYTEELEAELHRVRAAWQREQAVCDALNAPLLVIDDQGRILRGNSAAAQLFPITLPLDGENPLQCASTVTCACCFRETCPLPVDTPAACEVSVSPPDGMARTFLLAASPVRNAAGRKEATALLFTEITSRQEIYDELMCEYLALAEFNTGG